VADRAVSSGRIRARRVLPQMRVERSGSSLRSGMAVLTALCGRRLGAPGRVEAGDTSRGDHGFSIVR